jgi:hypothetical protein
MKAFLPSLLLLAGCLPLLPPSDPPPVVDAGPPAGDFQLVRGEIFEGSGPSRRHVRAAIRLHNASSMPESLNAFRFKLRLSSGVEVMGSDADTLGIPSACPNGDVSVGKTTSCSIEFVVDLTTATVTGISYTMNDSSQLVVEKAFPTCEQCGLLQGCPDFEYSETNCGGCGIPCGMSQLCHARTCRSYLITTPTADTCDATCAATECLATTWFSSTTCDMQPVGCSGSLTGNTCGVRCYCAQ